MENADHTRPSEDLGKQCGMLTPLLLEKQEELRKFKLSRRLVDRMTFRL